MKKIDLMVAKAIDAQIKVYEKQATKNKKDIEILRDKLTKERNREQYLRRCIQSLNEQLGHHKAGQLTFDV